jgi:hypothetical protein
MIRGHGALMARPIGARRGAPGSGILNRCVRVAVMLWIAALALVGVLDIDRTSGAAWRIGGG